MPPQPQQPQALDPDAVNLAKAIRTVETHGDYAAPGASGEQGGYQFMPDTWKAWSKQYLGREVPLDKATPVEQNEVAYKRIKERKDQGLNVGQIASEWNSGDPNAYLNNHVGVNAKGVKYNTPDYAKKVAEAYQQLKTAGGGSQVASVGGANIAQAAGNTPQPQDDQSFLHKAVDFAFPILNDFSGEGANKTTMQKVGDAALSALWFVPGLGEVAGGAIRGVPLAAKLLGEGGIKTASNILAGGAVGYGADVGGKLAAGQTDAGQVLTPGLGTITGGAIGGIAGKLGGMIGKNTTQSGALSALQKNIEENLNATKTGRVFMDAAKTTGHNPAELIAKSGAIPDVVDSKFATGPQQQYMAKRIAALGEARAEALDSMGTAVGLSDLEKMALQGAKDPTIIASGESDKIARAIKRLFADFKSNYGDTISVTDLEKIKEAQAKASGIYKKTGQIGEQNASSIIGKIARTRIEEIADQSGLPGMKEYNNFIKAHYTAIDALKKMNGQAVKGGRLGNMLRGHAAGTAAAFAGNAVGGPLGAMGGFLAAEGANKIFSKILGDTALSNPLRDAILKRIEQANPGVVDQMLKFTGNQGKKVAPLMTPKGTKGSGLVSQTLGQSAARLVPQQKANAQK